MVINLKKIEIKFLVELLLVFLSRKQRLDGCIKPQVGDREKCDFLAARPPAYLVLGAAPGAHFR